MRKGYGNREVWTCDGCLEGLHSKPGKAAESWGAREVALVGPRAESVGQGESVPGGLGAAVRPSCHGAACVPGCEPSVSPRLKPEEKEVSG